MTLSVHEKTIHQIHKLLNCKIEISVVREIFLECKKDPKRCTEQLKQKMKYNGTADSQKKTGLGQDQNARSEHFLETRNKLREEINTLYKIKAEKKTQSEKNKVQKRIDDKVIKWNKMDNDSENLDLHWMSPNGAAFFALQIIDEVMEWNDRVEEEEENFDVPFQNELTIVTGRGNNSANGISTIQMELMKKLEEHPRRSEFSVKMAPRNNGLVVVRFEGKPKNN